MTAAEIAPQSLRALIVDDESRWRAILSEILSELGCTITATAAPPAHLDSYDLAVLDIALDPNDARNRDGLTLLRRLAQSGTRCLMLSGWINLDVQAEIEREPHVLGVLHKDGFQRTTFVNLIQQAFTLPQTRWVDVLIVEDDARWRAIYADVLSDSGHTLHQAASYAEARGWLQRGNFALAIVDLQLASSAAPQDNRDGFWLLRAAQQRGLPTIVVSALGRPDDIDRAYEEFGVFAFVEKEGFDRRAFRHTVADAIGIGASSAKLSAPTVTPDAGRPIVELTDRERDVLRFMVQGYTNRQIAEALNITPNTVKKHVDHILQKLEVSNRAAAVAVALRDRLE